MSLQIQDNISEQLFNSAAIKRKCLIIFRSSMQSWRCFANIITMSSKYIMNWNVTKMLSKTKRKPELFHIDLFKKIYGKCHYMSILAPVFAISRNCRSKRVSTSGILYKADPDPDLDLQKKRTLYQKQFLTNLVVPISNITIVF